MPVMMTDDEEAVVPEIGGSLTSITWNEDLMDVFDSSSVDKINRNVDVASDDRCDFSFGRCQLQTDVR